MSTPAWRLLRMSSFALALTCACDLGCVQDSARAGACRVAAVAGERRPPGEPARPIRSGWTCDRRVHHLRVRTSLKRPYSLPRSSVADLSWRLVVRRADVPLSEYDAHSESCLVKLIDFSVQKATRRGGGAPASPRGGGGDGRGGGGAPPVARRPPGGYSGDEGHRAASRLGQPPYGQAPRSPQRPGGGGGGGN